ncbi:MAG: hypothetical protein IJJ20_04065, partial [Thermoguttaceae bacterium]|nr:hypothetical protein [Thermoguttaceae bacterium]
MEFDRAFHENSAGFGGIGRGEEKLFRRTHLKGETDAVVGGQRVGRRLGDCSLIDPVIQAAEREPLFEPVLSVELLLGKRFGRGDFTRRRRDRRGGQFEPARGAAFRRSEGDADLGLPFSRDARDCYTQGVYNELGMDISKEFFVSKSKELLFWQQQSGVDEKTFQNTALIGQKQIILQHSDTNEMIQKISNLVLTGDDNISYKKSLDKINKRQTEEIGNDRTKQRPINVVADKI